jgi:hypothetical protein
MKQEQDQEQEQMPEQVQDQEHATVAIASAGIGAEQGLTQEHKHMLDQEHTGPGGMTPVARREEKLYVVRSSCRMRSRCWDGAGAEA